MHPWLPLGDLLIDTQHDNKGRNWKMSLIIHPAISLIVSECLQVLSLILHGNTSIAL